MNYLILIIILASSNAGAKHEYPDKSEITLGYLTQKESNEISLINGSCGSNVFYTLDQISNTLTLYGSGDMDNFYKCPFPNNQNIRHVIIENSITSIGEFAFYQCTSLFSIDLPDSLIQINSKAFYLCQSLSSIIIPKSVAILKYNIFSGCKSLSSVIMLGNISIIPENTFYQCSSLSYFAYKGIINPNIQYSHSPFNGTYQLKSVDVEYLFQGDTFCGILINRAPPEKLEYKGEYDENLLYTFNTSSNVLTISGSGNMTNYNSTYSPFLSFRYITKQVILDENITLIGDYAFYDFKSLLSINIPDKVISIGKYAFYYCSSLSSIKIPDTIKIINDYTFSHCIALTSINISLINYIYEGAFSYCYNFTSFDLPNSIKRIPSYCFQGCINLISISIPDTITDISSYSFEACKSLVSIKIPISVDYISVGVFSNCINLISINIPDSIKVISSSLFSNCYSLTSLKIPDGVNSIGSYAFSNCRKLASIKLPNVTYIDGYSFYKCSSLASLDIPNSVKTIESCAFAYCNLITTFVIPAKVILIGNYAFSRCSSLSSVLFNGCIQPRFGKSPFSSCNNLKSVKVYEYYGGDMFLYLPVEKIELTGKLIINESLNDNIYYTLNKKTLNLTIYGSGPLPDYNSTNQSPFTIDYAYIKHVYINNGITSIGNYTFYNCPFLTTINLTDRITQIGNYAFYRCVSLSVLDIPDSVTYIGEYCFYNCSSIHSITIPASVTIIKKRTFSYCSRLTSIIFNGNVSELKDYSFEYSTALSYIFYKGYNEPKITKYSFSKANLNSVDVMNYYEKSTFNGISVRIINSADSMLFKGTCGENVHYILDPITGNLTIYGSGQMTNYTYNSSPFIGKVRYAHIENGVTSIGDYSFYLCRGLLEIEIPESVTYIGSCGFFECSSLTSITIPNVSVIKYKTFYRCENLASITFLYNITNIEEDSFDLCNYLEYIIYKGTNVPKYHYQVFTFLRRLEFAIVMYNYNYFDFCTIPIGQRILPENPLIKGQIGDNIKYVFDYRTSMLSITGVGALNGNGATTPFVDLQNIIKYIEIGENITSIGSSVFKSLGGLKSVIINGTLNEVSDDAFGYCFQLNYMLYKGKTKPNPILYPLSRCDKLESIDVFYYYQYDDFLLKPTKVLIPDYMIECNSDGPLGCLYCSKDNPMQCLSCNSKQFFEQEVSVYGNCECMSMYELNESNICVPEVTKCEESRVKLGCSLCLLSNINHCTQCDVDKGFNIEPIHNSHCTCNNSDHQNQKGICAEHFTSCIWGDKQPILGCKWCTTSHFDRCALCDEWMGFVLNKEKNYTCECKYDGFQQDANGYCKPPTESHCNEEVSGCIKCDENDNNKCIICDQSKGFRLDSDICKCEIEGYIINNNGYCMRPPYSLCSPNISMYGCIKCAENDDHKCLICDPSLNFTQQPNNDGICECASGFSLDIDGNCFEYVQEKPVLSFNNYVGTKEIADDCITVDKSSLTINTNKMENNEDYNSYKLYEKQIDSSITDINIEKNTFENIQLTTKNRKDKELNVQIEPNQKIQLDTSDSDFPINLPPDSKNINIKVETADSTLEIRSNGANINLGNVSISENSFVINSKKDITVEIVNLFGGSKFSRSNSNDNFNTAKLKAKKVNIQKGSESQISNVLILEQLNLAPNSVITIIENVDFNLSEFSIYKTNSQRMDHSYFKFNQKVSQFPKQIQIKEMNENSYLDNYEDKVIVIHQSNDILSNEMCKQWAEHIVGYNGHCVINDLFNSGHNSVYATKDKNQDGGNDDNNSKPDGKGLSGGAIAGIVIGCVAAVAIVVFLVYFFVIKKKYSNSSSENDKP